MLNQTQNILNSRFIGVITRQQLQVSTICQWTVFRNHNIICFICKLCLLHFFSQMWTPQVQRVTLSSVFFLPTFSPSDKVLLYAVAHFAYVNVLITAHSLQLHAAL